MVNKKDKKAYRASLVTKMFYFVIEVINTRDFVKCGYLSFREICKYKEKKQSHIKFFI